MIQEGVNFNKLGLSVIDEQHRFGVYQRMAFNYKGFRPSILVMSATPIPRTLTLAAYGDMDESRLIEKPIGRKPIKTSVLTLKKEKNLIERIKKNKIIKSTLGGCIVEKKNAFISVYKETKIKKASFQPSK